VSGQTGGGGELVTDRFSETSFHITANAKVGGQLNFFGFETALGFKSVTLLMVL
jgi:hypothetical protein